MLRIKLKPQEKIIINGAVIQNDDSKVSSIDILNKANVLKESDIVKISDSNKNVFNYLSYIAQMIYIDGSNDILKNELLEELTILEKTFSTDISNLIQYVKDDDYYSFIKVLKPFRRKNESI